MVVKHLEKGRILIADDEVRMRKLVSDFLKREGYAVSEAEDGKSASEAFFRDPDFDLVILDVMMPYKDGWEVCREIRERSQVPVIMLTAKSEEFDELLGFSLGADEYITKPFSPMVLVARVQALLRRTGKERKPIKPFEGFVIDEAGHSVQVDGESVDLSPKEFELLLYFVENRGLALSRDQILNKVWDHTYLGDVRTVDTHVKNLRLKLGTAGDFIQTIRGLGYKFEVKK